MFGRRRSDAESVTDLSRTERAYLRVMNSRAMQSQTTMRLAGIFFAVVVALGLYLWFFPATPAINGGTAVPAPAISLAPSPAAPSMPDSAGLINGCAAQEGEEVMPETVALTEMHTEWKAIGQVSIPGSVTGGPEVQEPYPHCFNRNPEGALYSIATFFAERAEAGSNQGMVDVMARRCLHDDNYEAYTARLVNDTPVKGVPVTVINGYRWMEYTPGRAQVELRFKLVTGPSAGATTTNVFSVIWKNNDWLILSPHPDQPTQVPGNNLRTFHTWGASG